MDEDLPATAGDKSSVPGTREVAHAREQLRPCSTTVGLVLWSPEATAAESTCCSRGCLHALEPTLCSSRSHCSETPEHRDSTQ